MLHIILFILKCIGCVLLALLALILLLLLIVLLMPIRYNVSGNYYGTPEFSGKVTWLLGILKAQAEFKDKKFRLHVKIFWKTLFDSGKETSEEEIKESVSDTKVNPIPENSKTDVQNEADVSIVHTTSDPSKTPVDSSVVKQNKESDVKEDKKQNKNQKRFSFKRKKVKKPEKTKVKGEKVPFLEKIVLWIDRMIDKIDDTMDQIDEKVDQVSNKVSKVERFIQAECTQNSLMLLKKMLISILKHIAPSKISGKVHFGLDKPSKTGRIIGYASAFYPLYGNSLQLIPDFENKIIEGNLDVRGKVQLYIFVVWAIRAILSKDIRKLIKYVKHLKN